MNRLYKYILALLLILCFTIPTFAMPGSGTEADPYIIDDATDLKDIENDMDAYYELANDIDLGGGNFEPIGYESGLYKTDFEGHFDGKGYKIYNGSIGGDGEYSSSWYTGVFAGNTGTIQNLGVDGVDVTGWDMQGGLSGINYNGGTIKNCYATGNVSGTDGNTGGLVGRNSEGTIENCYATGDVDDDADVGGLVGINYKGIIRYCYSTGKPTGDGDVGGLVGSKTTGGDYEDTDNYWDTTTSETSTSEMGTGKTTTQMQDIDTFDPEWDIVNILDWIDEDWYINDGNDYPRLGWERDLEDLFDFYDQRIKLTIDHTEIDSDLDWFPVTVHLTDSQGEEVFTEFDADEDFDRIAFTTSDEETQLYADCELFDVSESKAIYHVSKDGWTVSSSADTEIYLYYDDTASHNTTYISKSGDTAAQSVWDSSFEAVYHMQDDTTSTILDATSNNNDGDKKASNEPAEATGKVGQGQDFDGSDDYIDLGGNSDLETTDGTIESITYLDDLVSEQYFYWKEEDGDNKGGLAIFDVDNGDGYLDFAIKDSGSWDVAIETGDISATTWQYFVGTWGSDGAELFVNAVSKGTDISTNGLDHITGGNVYIGARMLGTERSCNGIMDEVRVSSLQRSAAWISATYASLWDSLLTYSAEETAPTEEVSNTLFLFSNF